MRVKILVSTLLLTTALTSPLLAQQAAAPAKPLTPEEELLLRKQRQSLTDNPVDVGRLQLGNGGKTVSNGGVTNTAPGGGNIIEEDTPKARSTVTRDAIDRQSPTSNPFQLIQLAPGANVSSTDAFGLNGGNITVRGFNSDQIGVTIEGAPVNDSGNYAVYPQEYVDAPNLGQVSLAQGAPDLDSPHIGATGGVLNIYMRDPAKTFGGYASQAIGTHGGTQSFGRIDTGKIGGFRGYMSYSHYERNHWTGPGSDNRDHVDFKGVYEFDAQNKVSFSAIYNSAVNNFYVQPTLAQFASHYTYLSALPATAITGPDQTANSAANFYGYKINPFKNLILSAPSSFTPANNLTYDVIPYFWYGYGSGGGVSGLKNGSVFYGNTKLTDTFNANPLITNTLFYNPSITETYRPGIINKLTYQFGDHKLIAGYWFEYANHHQTAPYIPLASDGTIADPFAGNSQGYIIKNGLYYGSTLMRRDATTKTTTHTFFAGDSFSMFNDALNVEIGAKQVFINRDVTNRLPGASNINVDLAATLPTLGLRYNLNKENQIFGSINTTVRTPPNYAFIDTFSGSTGKISTKGVTGQKNESAVTFEFGHRYQSDFIVSSASVFATNYRNRQVTTTVIDGGSTITESINAGSVSSYGIDGEIGTKPFWGGWTIYASGELMHTRLNDNLMVGADFLPTKGKQMVRAPNHSEALSIKYDTGHFYAGVSLKNTGSQFSTFMNDERIGSFAQVDALAGYRFDDMGFVKKPELKLNLHNLFNRRVLTGVSGVQTNALATTGVNGTVIAGSAPSYYQGEGFAAILTLSGAF